MKVRANELRAEGKKGAKKAHDLQAALDSIAKMAADDRVLAERVHATVTANAVELSPKTWCACHPTRTQFARSSSRSRIRANSTRDTRP